MRRFRLLNLLFGLDLRSLLGHLGFDDVDFIADIHAVGHRPFMAIFADDVLAEEAVGAIVGRGREADKIGVEILDDLSPEVVDERWHSSMMIKSKNSGGIFLL